jgi:hypothetical protein
MPTQEKHDTHQKALSFNATIPGYFAEIGAGQEVARWFLRVGGASGTVAKTISAYDKEVRVHLYGSGTGTRYVSKPRLQSMLDGEAVAGAVGRQPGAVGNHFPNPQANQCRTSIRHFLR